MANPSLVITCKHLHTHALNHHVVALSSLPISDLYANIYINFNNVLLIHSSSDMECKWNTRLVEITEGEDVEVMLFSSCSRRHYSTGINISVLCVPNAATGVTPGLLA